MTIDQALTLAFQFVNQPMADLAIKEMADELAGYPEPAVLAALKRCRSELKSIKFGDILDRIPGGHPGVEEAWSIVSVSMQDEGATIIWTDQMREAFGVANALSDDPVAARMAFKECYGRAVSEARIARQLPKWSVSLGTHKPGRELAIIEGVKHGRISPAHARKLLPYSDDPNAGGLLDDLAPRLIA